VTEEIKVDYQLMAEMKQTFQAGQEQLTDTLNELKGIADKLDEGALLGQAGSAFSDAVRGALMGSVQKLADKFEELQGDVQFAVDRMREAEQQVKSTF
jgi:WXG100 family type VII secretion target